MPDNGSTTIGSVHIDLGPGYSASVLEPAPVPESTDRERSADAVGEEAILQALEQAGMELVQAVAVDQEPAEQGTLEAAGAARESAAVSVPRRADERIAILVDQDGYLRWVFERAESVPPTPEGAGAELDIQVSLELPLTLPVRTDSSGVAHETTGGKKWAERLKLWVLRMSARLVGKPAAQALVDLMEKNRRTGLVHIRAPWLSESAWRLIDGMADVSLPTGRRPRILLLIHGTFVNMDGSYSLLPATQLGRTLLRRAIKEVDDATGERKYDAVIGYDHLTLSATPLENAYDLVDLMCTRQWKHPPIFDVVTTSRGSLVARSLIERAVPSQSRPLGWTFRKVIMIAPANGGSELARYENWDALLDQLTNLAKVTAKVAAWVAPGVGSVVKGVTSVVVGVAWLVKVLGYAAIEQGLIPGLAAMDPNGDFIKDLNGQPLPEGVNGSVPYHRVTSDFEWKGGEDLPYLGDEHKLGAKVLLKAADAAVDKLFADIPNDLVNDVPNASVGHPDLAAWFAVAEHLHYGPNRWIHHLNHFLQPQTLAAIAGWLGLTALPGYDLAPESTDDGAVARSFDGLAQDADVLAREYAQDLADLGVAATVGQLAPRTAAAAGLVGGVPTQLLTDLDPDALAEAWRRDETGTREFLDAYLEPKESMDLQLDLEEMNRSGAMPEAARARYDGPDILFLPGLPGAHLAAKGGHGWRPWFNPLQFGKGNLAEALRLGPDGVRPAGGVPALTQAGSIGVVYNPAFRRWRRAGIEVHDHGFDWRKPLTHAARLLGQHIDRLHRESPGKRLALVGHSTGAFVAALWAARDPEWYEKVESAVFIGGALGGTFTAYEMLSGKHELIGTIADLTVDDTAGQLHETAVTWPGLVHLLPARGLLNRPGVDLFDPGVWKAEHTPDARWILQSARLKSEVLQSPLLAVSTAIVRADIGTVEEVLAIGDALKLGSPRGPGDGTIPIDLAVVPGLAQVYVSDVGSHSSMPSKGKVAKAVRDILRTGKTERLQRSSIEALRTAPAVVGGDGAQKREAAGGGRLDQAAKERLLTGRFTARDQRALLGLWSGPED